MSSTYRRFEILLPLRFNDGNHIPEALIAETLLEIEDRFGAVSIETQPIHGRWRNQGRTYRDELTRVLVDVPDVPENAAFFRNLKETLKNRFQQIDIWMSSHPVEIL